MAKTGVTLGAVWRMGAELPGVEKSAAWGSPALKVKGRGGRMEIVVCVPVNKAAEPGSRMFRVEREERTALLSEAPEIYYAPEHYLPHGDVLVRLAQLTPELARDLLAMSYQFVTGKRAGR